MENCVTYDFGDGTPPRHLLKADLSIAGAWARVSLVATPPPAEAAQLPFLAAALALSFGPIWLQWPGPHGNCDSAAYQQASSVAAVLLCVYGVGVPVSLVVLGLFLRKVGGQRQEYSTLAFLVLRGAVLLQTPS